MSSLARSDCCVLVLYTFKGAPLIQFNSGTAVPTCNLTIPVTGGEIWSKEDSSDKKVLKGNTYKLFLKSLLLSDVRGSANMTSASIPPPADKTNSGKICIDFRSSKDVLVVVESPEADTTYEMKNPHLLTRLQEYFLSNALRYEIADVKSMASEDGVIELIPNMFIFVTFQATVSSSDRTPVDGESSLTILMQTAGSDKKHGDIANIQAAWSNTWTKLGVAPIPKGHSASIIINNSFFLQSFITKSLKGLNMTNEQGLMTSEKDGGMKLTAMWPPGMVRANYDFRSETDPLIALRAGYILELTFHERTVDPNIGEKQFTLTLDQAVRRNYEFYCTQSSTRTVQRSQERLA